MSKSLCVVVVCASLTQLTACREPTTGPLSASVVAETAAGASVSDAPEFDALSAFRVELSAVGSFQPGRPITVVATVKGITDVADVDVRIVLPDVEVASRNGWERGPAPIREELPAVARHRGRIQRGEVVVQRASFTVPKPGYYRVVAGAVKRSGEPDFDDAGHMMQWAVHREVWLWVSETGGRSTDAFDESVFPPGVVPTPGPLDDEGDVRRVANSSGAPQTAALSTTFTEHIVYFNYDTYAYEPLADARFQVVIKQGGSTISTTNGQTDSNGYFSAPCLASGQTADSKVWFEKASTVNVISSAVVLTLAASTPGFVGPLCTTVSDIYPNASSLANSAARIFINAQSMIASSRSFFQTTRAVVTYKMSTNVPDTYYSEGDDHIQIDTASTWGAFGIFSVAHEYGHALHHINLGGIKHGAGTCSSHAFTGYYNLGCAYSEGFADYHAAATVGAAGSLFASIRDGLSQVGQDGSINEGGVASLLYDLTDAANDETWDSVQFPGSYVAEIYRTCDSYQNFSWIRANGIDHMIYCFQNAIEAQQSTYFPNRSGVVYDQRESVTEPSGWSASAIRTLWLWNLRNQ